MRVKIEQHKQNLANMQKNADDYAGRLHRAHRDYENILSKIQFLEKQIKEAEKRGMDSFDPNRLLEKKARKICR